MKTANLLTLALVIGLCGCGTTRPAGMKSADATPPKDMPSVAALVDYLNDNGRRMQSVNVGDLDLDCHQGGKSFGLRGKMAVEKPRNFRLNASAIGNPELDLGSNSDEFWFWVKRGEGLKPGEPSPQFYCSYRDLQEGKVKIMPLPFQPEWIMETLGLGPYGPADKYTIDGDRTTIRLTEKSTSPQGRPVRKVIVFNRQPVPAPQPQVQQYVLLDDATGKEICSATILDVQVDKKTGAIVPNRIELRYPEQSVKLTLTMRGATVNGVVPAAFKRSPLEGVRSVDLAVLHLDPAFGRPDPKR